MKVLHSKGRDTFGAGIVTKEGKVLANIKDSYTSEKGGIHPTEAKIHHERVCDGVIKKALEKAKISPNKIDLISFSQGPGLPPCLVVGMKKAKELSRKLKKPLVGVNHCIAHLSVGEILTKCKDPVLLYLSGANTQVIAYEEGKYRIFGETLDQGAGNFIDAFARHTGIGFPGGPRIYEFALKGKKFIELPYTVKGMDVSFGGLLTNLKQKYDSGTYSIEDLSYSLQETIFAMLLEVSERAINHCGKKELLLGGGVACNKRLQEMAKKMCEKGGYRCFIPESQFLVDNGAQIAWQGLLQRKEAITNIDSIDIKPFERTDDVNVTWK